MYCIKHRSGITEISEDLKWAGESDEFLEIPDNTTVPNGCTFDLIDGEIVFTPVLHFPEETKSTIDSIISLEVDRI